LGAARLAGPDGRGLGRLKPWHDVYLKQWQLSGPRLDFDVLLYDECQPDGTEVWTLEDGHGDLSGRVGKAKIEDLKVGNRVLSYNRPAACEHMVRW